MSTYESQTPTLQGLLNSVLAQHKRKIRQCIPARVETYDEATRKASVLPLLMDAFTDSAGERQTEALPVITNVPVVFPGSGGTRVRWPVARGDVVLLLFSSASLDKWLARGGMVDPGDDRAYDLNDCVAIPGFSDFATADDAGVMIEFTASGQIHAGGDQALATKADLEALRTWIATHKHSGVTTGAGISAVFDPTSGPLPTPTGTLTLKGA
jgi:hypothetical protein